MKMQKTFLALALLIVSLSFGQNNTFPTPSGNVGIGTTTPTEKLEVQGVIKSVVPTVLGGTLNNFQLLNERAGKVSSNTIYNRLWLVRDQAGSDWYTARFHDGLSVDASFATPRIDTRTWWERDPNDNIQSWGNATNTYLTINNGNIGVGTTTPTTKFEVVGSAKISDYSPVLTLQRNSSSGGYIQGIQTKDFLGTDNWFFGNLNANSWMVSKGDFQNPKLTILDNGNVGVGTTGPTEKMEVVGNLKVWGNLTLNTNADNLLNFNHPNNNSYQYFNFNQGGAQKAWFGMDPANNFFINKVNGGYIVFAGSKVGIGTANPDEMLTVKGRVHAEEIVVTANVTPDYVFQKYYTGTSALKSDYTMPTLAEIESFTKKNNHLPSVPSAKEMQQKGMSLGEMSNILLQKIEELTLYAIEQQKELERLKTENENYKSLAERVAAIEKELKK